jgi:Uma2 family endonuclease
MNIRTGQRKMTYEDLQALPDDRFRHELIDGEHIVSPSPSVKHQRVARNIGFAIFAFVRPSRLGEVFLAPLDVLFTRFDVVEPDVLYVAAENAERLLERYVDGAPDLVVEVLSPSSRSIDKVRKPRLYDAHGVREYWLADPKTDTLGIYRRDAAGRLALLTSLSLAAGDVLETPLLPGLRIPLPEIFG